MRLPLPSSCSLRRLRLFAAIPSVVFISSASARADLTFTRVFTVNQLVPNGGEYADARTLSLGGATITDVNVGLVLTPPANDATWAGDYYAAVGHSTGYAVLLNRIGKTTTDDYGSGANGLNVTFDDSASSGDIHAATYDSNAVSPPAVSGTWAPDAREADPAVVTDLSPRTAFLSSFNGTSTDGEWRLLIADDSPGGTARLNSWSIGLTFTAAPSAPLTVTSADTLTVSTPQTLSGTVVNQGLVIAPTAPGQSLALSGSLSGAGHYRGNFALLGSFSPGNSPAAITFDGDLLFGPGHQLTMEIGGTTPGTGYDTLNVTGQLSFGGSLNIAFINGFIPAPGNSFQLFTATSFGGSFAQVTFNSFGNYVWDTSQLLSSGLITLSSIPEPSSFAALAGLAAGVSVFQRRRRVRTAPSH